MGREIGDFPPSLFSFRERCRGSVC
uniref:Uncharacterized protein n=1 Tax=Arundo donax TaxID=35708 RepID=A0A0A9EQG0_ARUDO